MFNTDTSNCRPIRVIQRIFEVVFYINTPVDVHTKKALELFILECDLWGEGIGDLYKDGQHLQLWSEWS